MDIAEQSTPAAVGKVADTLLERLGTDRAPTAEDAARTRDINRNRLSLRNRRDGGVDLRGRLGPEGATLIKAVIADLARDTLGPEDERPLEERQGDGLVELARYAAEAPPDALPVRKSAEIGVTVDWEDVVGSWDETGRADTTGDHDGPAEWTTEHWDDDRSGENVGTVADVPWARGRHAPTASPRRSGPLPRGQVLLGGVPWRVSPADWRRLACDARAFPAILGGTSEPLDVGRSQRTVTTAQRHALTIRDKGCVFPGCARPVKFTEAHHLWHWLDLGGTDIDNLALLCWFHHTLIHHSRWNIRMIAGIPHIIPPAHVDPHRIPTRNHIHHAKAPPQGARPV